MVARKFFAEKEQVQEAYTRLGSTAKVATELGVSKKLVLTYMKQFGIVRKRRLISEVGDLVSSLALDGWDLDRIAAHVGFSRTAVSAYARTNGVVIIDKFHKGFIITDSGYIKRMAKDHPKADGKGYVAEHRLVMEAHLGRLLTEDEVVHHKDRDRCNNDICNLEVLPPADHKRLHLESGDCGGWSETYFARGKKI